MSASRGALVGFRCCLPRLPREQSSLAPLSSLELTVLHAVYVAQSACSCNGVDSGTCRSVAARSRLPGQLQLPIMESYFADDCSAAYGQQWSGFRPFLVYVNAQLALCRWQLMEVAAGKLPSKPVIGASGITDVVQWTLATAAANNLTVLRSFAHGVDSSFPLQTKPGAQVYLLSFVPAAAALEGHDRLIASVSL